MFSLRFATKRLSVALVILSLLVTATAQSNVESKKQLAKGERAQANLAFVTEYVRELSAVESIRASAEQEQTKGEKEDTFSNAIYTSKRMQFELRTQIGILKGMHLDAPFETLIPSLIKFYGHKIELYQKLIEISSAFIGGPEPGVDYGKLAAEVPQIRADLDDTDNSLLEATPFIFATLIDLKEDSQNHASHLIITRTERAQLLSDITTDFGSKLDQKDPHFQVSAAIILKMGLLKDFKSSDDPWE